MEIDHDALTGLLDFLGYGNLKSPYWFIGMEETAAGHDDVEANIRVRLDQWHQVMDLAVAYDEAHLNKPVCEQKRYPSRWMFMAKIARAMTGKPDWNETAAAKSYVCESLGQLTGETFLADLLPLPRKSGGRWPAIYRDWLGSRSQYRARVLDRRKRLLRQAVIDYRPRFVFCYGESHYDEFREIARVEPSDWQQLPDSNIYIGKYRHSWFALTPFYSHTRLSSADLERLVTTLKAAHAR